MVSTREAELKNINSNLDTKKAKLAEQQKQQKDAMVCAFVADVCKSGSLTSGCLYTHSFTLYLAR